MRMVVTSTMKNPHTTAFNLALKMRACGCARWAVAIEPLRTAPSRSHGEIRHLLEISHESPTGIVRDGVFDGRQTYNRQNFFVYQGVTIDPNHRVGIIAGCEGSEPKASGPYNRRRKIESPL